MNNAEALVVAYPYVQRVHDDTLDLLVEMRDFCAFPRKRETSAKAAYRNFNDAIHRLRITSRLELALSWVFYAKAGEEDKSAAVGEFIRDLAGFIDDDSVSGDVLCPVLSKFHERSNHLIRRILHLDQSRAMPAPRNG